MIKIDKELNAAECGNFNELYPTLVEHLVKNGSYEPSRNGDTIELLDFKTIVRKPAENLVGGYGRNMNVFFLFAEAIWIWLGKKEVNFLKFFNAQMGEYSDDKKNFHAPYGWRLRKWSIPSIESTLDPSICFNDAVAKDQLKHAIFLLDRNKQDRGVVMSIWNPDFDLGTKTLDRPCNDLVMLKVRQNKLYMTIQNRSNDLHWGLPTNVFQFSFIGFLMSQILGVERGTQVHNSQSLHIYTNIPLTLQILNKMEKNPQGAVRSKDFEGIGYRDIYQGEQIEQKINFPKDSTALEKLNEVDSMLSTFHDHLNLIIEKHFKGEEITSIDFSQQLQNIKQRSEYLYTLLQGIVIYTKYVLEGHTAIGRQVALNELKSKFEYQNAETLMMKNFFLTRMKHEDCLDL